MKRTHDEINAELRAMRVIAIANRKRQGVDCTEDESAAVKRYFDRYATATDAEQDTLAGLFPLEFAEWCDDVEQARRPQSHAEIPQGFRLCAACDVLVPESDETHPNEWQCANPKCGIWFHVGGDNRCPECGTLPDGAPIDSSEEEDA